MHFSCYPATAVIPSLINSGFRNDDESFSSFALSGVKNRAKFKRNLIEIIFYFQLSYAISSINYWIFCKSLSQSYSDSLTPASPGCCNLVFIYGSAGTCGNSIPFTAI
jgi:hypothetical protein